MLLIVGLCSLGLLGFLVGAWTNGLADYLRCQSVGNDWAVQTAVCPRWNLRGWLESPLIQMRSNVVSISEKGRFFLPGGLVMGSWMLSFFWMIRGRFSMIDFAILLVWQAGLALFAVTDARWRILPVEAMIGVGVICAILRIVTGSLSLISSVLGIVFAVCFFGVQYGVSRGRWLGAGDPWMAAMIGAVLGWPLVGISVYFTYMLGIFVIAWAFTRRQIAHRLRYPFGPLLAVGAQLALFFGPDILAFLRG